MKKLLMVVALTIIALGTYAQSKELPIHYGYGKEYTMKLRFDYEYPNFLTYIRLIKESTDMARLGDQFVFLTQGQPIILRLTEEEMAKKTVDGYYPFITDGVNLCTLSEERTRLSRVFKRIWLIRDEKRYNFKVAYRDKWVTDESEIDLNVLSEDLSEFLKNISTEKESPREYVNLGLPSGTLWATTNIGASLPEEYGVYFVWGDSITRRRYYANAYFDSSYSKYNSDGGLIELEPENDAASVKWGKQWRIPSKEQFDELINNKYTTTQWTQQNGVYGRKITSKSNGNSIFLPATGYRSNSSLNNDGSNGYYWTRTLSLGIPSDAWSLYFNSGNVNTDYDSRCNGLTVRPVLSLE